MNKMHLKHEKKVKEARGWISPDGKAKYKEYIFEREREKKINIYDTDSRLNRGPII